MSGLCRARHRAFKVMPEFPCRTGKSSSSSLILRSRSDDFLFCLQRRQGGGKYFPKPGEDGLPRILGRRSENGIESRVVARPSLRLFVRVQRICHAIRELLQQFSQLRSRHLGDIDVYVGHVGRRADAPFFNFTQQVHRSLRRGSASGVTSAWEAVRLARPNMLTGGAAPGNWWRSRWRGVVGVMEAATYLHSEGCTRHRRMVCSSSLPEPSLPLMRIHAASSARRAVLAEVPDHAD